MKKGFISFSVIVAMIVSTIAVVAHGDEIAHSSLIPKGYVYISYTSYSGWTKPATVTPATNSRYTFKIEGDSKNYIMLDSSASGDEYYLMRKEGSNEAWDTDNPSTAVDFEFDTSSTSQVPGRINLQTGIDKYITSSMQGYVKAHNYAIEGITDTTVYGGGTVNCKYSLLSLSEYVAYSDKVGFQEGAFFLRSPYNSSGTSAQGGASLTMQKTKSGLEVPCMIKTLKSNIRPSFWIDGEFFQNVRIDLKTAGIAVLQEVLKTENSKGIYTDKEWSEINLIDITGAEETMTLSSNGSRIKSGFTITASNLPSNPTGEKFIISEDNENWNVISDNSGLSNTCILKNNMANKYIRFYAESGGKKYVSPSVKTGENLSSFLPSNKYSLDEKQYELCGEIHFEAGGTYPTYGFSVLDSDEDRILLLSKQEVYLENYEKDPSAEIVQKYDINDPLSIAYKINQTSFITKYILPAQYHRYILESEWETEAGYLAPMDNDTVCFAKLALPANWELRNYAGAFGYGIAVGAMLRTPAPSKVNDASTEVITNAGKLIYQAQNKKSYYSPRFEFWVDRDLFKTLKLDINRADELALQKLDFPSMMTQKEAENMGYTAIELARMGYSKIGALTEGYICKDKICGYIEYVNYDKTQNAAVIAAVYDKEGRCKETVSREVTLNHTDAYDAENKQRVVCKMDLKSEISDGDVAKLFLWDSFNTIAPVNEAKRETDDVWDSKYYEEDFFNLVTSFCGDAKTTRGFAWESKPNCADMVIRYGTAGDDLNMEKASVFEACDVAYSMDKYKAEGTPDAPPKMVEFMLFHKAELENLTPGTKYYYRIGDKTRDIWGDIYEFETEAENVTDFSVLCFTDPQASLYSSFSDYYTPTWQAALSDCPDAEFTINGGDLTSNSLWDDWTYNFLKSSRGMCESLPLMATMGNHDTGHSRSAIGARNFALHFDYPQNGYGLAEGYDFDKTGKSRYATAIIKELDGSVYSFDYGNAHFTVLNSGPIWGSPRDLLELQTEWLDEDLKSTDQKWKVVLLHIPIYASDGTLSATPEQYGNMYTRFRDIIETNKVDLVLSGDTHLYMRTKQLNGGNVIDAGNNVTKGCGTVYTIMGLSGSANGNAASSTDLPTLVAARSSMGANNGILPCYNTLHFTESSLTYTTKFNDGTFLDSVVIEDE